MLDPIIEDTLIVEVVVTISISVLLIMLTAISEDT